MHSCQFDWWARLLVNRAAALEYFVFGAISSIAPGIHHTMGGVAITPESEVLDIQSRPIPGLYAAGEVTGGVHGFNRLGGNAIADTVVFGRRSGEHAAAYALKAK